MAEFRGFLPNVLAGCFHLMNFGESRRVFVEAHQTIFLDQNHSHENVISWPSPLLQVLESIITFNGKEVRTNVLKIFNKTRRVVWGHSQNNEINRFLFISPQLMTFFCVIVFYRWECNNCQRRHVPEWSNGPIAMFTRPFGWSMQFRCWLFREI